MIFLLIFQLWTSVAIPGDSKAILNGVWQSCKQQDGQYGELIYDRVEAGKWQWEFHLGPFHEFGLYTTAQPDEHAHSDSTNLLNPYQVTNDGSNRFIGDWKIPSLKLRLHVTIAGGSSNDCECFLVLLSKTGS